MRHPVGWPCGISIQSTCERAWWIALLCADSDEYFTTLNVIHVRHQYRVESEINISDIHLEKGMRDVASDDVFRFRRGKSASNSKRKQNRHLGLARYSFRSFILVFPRGAGDRVGEV